MTTTTSTSSSVTSKDGTRIAYTAMGHGPPLVLVDGAFCSRSFGPMPQLAPLLADRFRVFFYDRRGRGDSGDTAPHSIEREIDDVAALVEAAGGSAFVYGTSSGAVLAVRAAAAGVKITRLALYEPPLALDDKHHPKPADFREQIASSLQRGARGDAVKLFMKVVGVPAPAIFFMRLMPSVWKGLSAVAHTLPYDFAILGDTQSGNAMPSELQQKLSSISVPTLQMVGGKSPAWMHHAAKRVVEEIGGKASLSVIAGQDHNASAASIAPALTSFFTQQ